MASDPQIAQTRLDSRPRRLLTDRECTSLLGGMISTLMTNATPENVVTALNWWANHPEALTFSAQLTAVGREECTE